MRTAILHRATAITSRIRGRNQLLKNTLWMLMSQGGLIILQVFYFVVIARALGPQEYGAFIGATSLIAIFAPFVSFGSGSLIVKNVSRDPSLFGQYWGNALIIISVAGTAGIILVCLISPFLFPSDISVMLVFLAAIAKLICMRIVQIAGHSFQAVQQLKITAQINLLPGITRMVAVLAMLLIFPNPTAVDWTLMYLIGTTIAAAISFGLVQYHLGSPTLALERIRPELFEGFCFSAGLSSQTIYNDSDKAMLARFSTIGTTGVYAAAYRIVEVAFVPVRSLLAASYARFFQHGASGISSSFDYAKRLTPIAGFYGVIVGVGLIVCSPLIPYVFGDGFAESAQVLCWLAPLPFFKSMHYFAANSLAGAGLQSIRSVIQILIAVLNVCGNLLLIPTYSWKGAIWSSLASDALLALLLWALALFYSRRCRALKIAPQKSP